MHTMTRAIFAALPLCLGLTANEAVAACPQNDTSVQRGIDCKEPVMRYQDEEAVAQTLVQAGPTPPNSAEPYRYYWISPDHRTQRAQKIHPTPPGMLERTSGQAMP